MADLPLFEIFGTLIGILYVFLEYRASLWLWPVGVLMPAVYILIYYDAGIYADMGINVYFFLAAIYGWIVWYKDKRKATKIDQKSPVDEGFGIVRASAKEWGWSALVFFATFALIAYILVNFTTSTVPYSDSFTTALSIVGMWMLAHKRVEHWILWVVIDAVSVVMYINKGLYPTAILYALYTIIAIAGYIKWLKMMQPKY